MKKSMSVLFAMGMGAAFGAAAPYGSVVGCWQFNASPYKADSSLFGHDLTVFGENVFGETGSGIGENGYDGTGYLNLYTKGNQASGSSFGQNWIDSSKGYTILLRFNTQVDMGITGYSSVSAEIKRLLDHVTGQGAWHTLVYRYDPDKRVNANYTDTLYTDPHFGDGYGISNSRDGVSDWTQISGNHGNIYFPVHLTSDGITIGGEVGGTFGSGFSTKTKKGSFKGYFDDVTVVSRVMSWQEISRFHHTGETYVYPGNTATPGTLTFTSCGNWSYYQWASDSRIQNYAPSAIPGADFIVDNAWTVNADCSPFPCRSLTLGRLAHLVSRKDGHQVTASLVGKLVQKVTNLEIADLRLQYGEYAGDVGDRLNVTKLTVSAPETTPFGMDVDANRSFAVVGTAVGGGWLRMKGAGVLDLWNLDGEYKVETANGTTKCRHIDSYGGARIDVSDGEVTVAKTIRSLSKFVLKCTRTLTAAGDYPILTVRSSLFTFAQGRGYELTPDSMIAVESDAIRYDGLKVTENGDGSKTLSIVCKANTAEIPPEDKGSAPILIGE